MIETKRLTLREFTEADYDDLYEFLSQLENDEFKGYPGITYENGKEHLKYRVSSEEFFAIELKETGKVIGNIYCGKRDFDAREIGYIVNRDYQHQGYALEALTAVTDHLFALGTHRVYAECDPRNESSWRLLEASGFRREACFRQNIYFHKDGNGNPIWKDTYVYARLNDRYGSEARDEIYLSDSCDVYYLPDKNVVLVHWKKYCELEEYRIPLEYALRVIREHSDCDYVADTRDGFEDNPLDTRWVAEYFMPHAKDYGCRIIYFIIDKDNSLKDELEGQEKDSSSLLEFRYIYDINEID